MNRWVTDIRSSLWWLWFPLGLFSLLAIVLTWPLTPELGAKIPVGEGGDAWGHFWTFHWIKLASTQGLDPYYTKLLYYPDGASLVFHNIAWLNIGLWLPLQALWGEISAYGLTYLILFCLNGCVLYWLLYDWTGSPFAATVGGVVHLSWPYLMAQTGHPNTFTVMWIPLAILFLRRAIQKQRAIDIVMVGICLALTGISRWQLLLMGGIGFGLYYLYALWAYAKRPYWRIGLITLVSGIIAIGLMMPLGSAVFRGLTTLEEPSDLVIEESLDGSDLLAYVVPNGNSLVGQFMVETLPFRMRFTKDRVDFIGLFTLFLAFWGLRKRWPQLWIWAVIGGVYFCLSVGPDLTFGRVKYPQIPVPYRLVEDLFFVRMIRDPHRFNIFLALPMAVLAGYGADALRQDWVATLKSKGVQRLFHGGILLVVLLEHWIYPYRIAPIDVPEWYAGLAQMPDEFGLLSLPIGHDEEDKEYMRYQLLHGKPLAQGHISRATSEAYRFLDSTPFLAHLHATNQMDPNIGEITHQLDTLSEANIRFLILHKQLADEKQVAEWREWLLVTPDYEDEEVIVYGTQPQAGVDYLINQMVTDDIGLISLETNLDDLARQFMQGGTVQLRPTWGSKAQPTVDLDVCLYLAQENPGEGNEPTAYCQPLGESRPSSQWSDHEVVRQRIDIQLSPFQPLGTYGLTLGFEVSAPEAGGPELTETADNGVGQPVALGEFSVQPLPRQFDAPPLSSPRRATWQDEVQLLGYDLTLPDSLSAGATVQLLLHWQALQRMDRSYKFFVHMVNAEGTRVAQYDGIPRGWSYPTTFWEAGEYVTDDASFTVDIDLPAGIYNLSVGIVDEVTGERLIGQSDAGEALLDNTLLLEKIP